MTSPEIILVMIVRDESQVIERCLDSVRPLISGWLIVDTGSTDDTVDRIERSLSDLPGEIHHRDWVNFGHNRSEALALARGRGTHLLLVDADMTLHGDGTLPDLTADAHELRHDADPSYWIPRLLRSDHEWFFVGRTHEYLSCKQPYSRERLPQLVINDHADGGSRANKFERDKIFLQQSIDEDPTDQRSWFYLALTLRDLGETDAAISAFQQRISLGGWEEEVFYSLYQIGLLLRANDPNAAIVQLLSAWNFRPSRAEPLLELARLHRQRGQYALCELYASKGLALPRSTDSAFVHPEAHDWALKFELAIAWFHLGRIEEALALNDELLDGKVPQEMEPWVRHNRAWCLRSLGRPDSETLAHLAAGADIPSLGTLINGPSYTQISIEHAPGWSLFNPSVTNDPSGGLVINIRSSNYVIADDGSYTFQGTEDDEIIRTVNLLARLDENLTSSALGQIPAQPNGPAPRLSRVLGCEDVRLLCIGDSWKAVATVRDRNHYERCDIALLEIPSLENPETTTLSVIPGPDPARHEKNWMPFDVDGELHILYLCSPTVVGHLDDDAHLVIDSSTPGPPAATHFRGGSQGVAFANGVLFLVHEVTFVDAQRVYSHRFIQVTSSTATNGGSRWDITSMSAPFHFLELGIEFAAGLAIDGDDLIASFGVRDAEAWLVRMPAVEVAAQLVPLFQNA
jgi:tetratricopeptide (TPR) repeat protein